MSICDRPITQHRMVRKNHKITFTPSFPLSFTTAMSQETSSPDWALLLHLSLLLNWVLPIPFVGVITPLIVWQVGQKQHPSLDEHGRNALNWIISSTLYGTVLSITVVGILLLPILAGLGFIFPIIAAIRANQGKAWTYPLSINILGSNPERALRRATLGLLSLCILPVMGLLGSTAWMTHRHTWLAGLSPAQGTVTQILEKTDDEGDTLYKPRITFKDASGEQYQVSKLWWSSVPSYEEGDIVGVLYPPTQPEQAMLDDWPEKWFFPVTALVISAIALIFALIPSFCGFIIERFG